MCGRLRDCVEWRGIGGGLTAEGRAGTGDKVERTSHEAADAVEDVGESLEQGWNSTRSTISKALG